MHIIKIKDIYNFIFLIGILIFCYLGAHANLQNHTMTPSGGNETRQKEKKTPLIVET